MIIENNKNPNVNKNNLKNPQNWLHVFQCFYNLKNKDKRKKFNTPFRYRHYEGTKIKLKTDLIYTV